MSFHEYPSVVVDNNNIDSISEMNWDWLEDELERYSFGAEDVSIGLPMYWLFHWSYANVNAFSIDPSIHPQLEQGFGIFSNDNVDTPPDHGDHDTWGSQSSKYSHPNGNWD